MRKGINNYSHLYTLNIVILIIGFVIGIFILIYGNKGIIIQSYDYINLFYNEYDRSDSKFYFILTFIKYFKYILIIWFMAFIKYGFLASLTMLLYRGISLGFTTSFFIYNGIFIGILNIIKFYLIQNIIFIFLLLLMSVFSFKYSRRYFNKKKFNIKDYVIILCFGCFICFLISLYEVYIVNFFI